MSFNLGWSPSTMAVKMGIKRCGTSKVGGGGGVCKVSATDSDISCGDGGCSNGGQFPTFLPREVEKIKDPFARSLAQRITRIPVKVKIGFSETSVMSSCVKPSVRRQTKSPVVLLHCFDSSCLEWRCTYPSLEEAGLEAWAIDILGWGFCDLELRPPCDVASKRYHLYQLWKSYINRPMTLVGPSLGASAAIDFAANFPEAVDKLVLINPSVYTKGTGNLAKLPVPVAYAGVSLLRSLPLRLYATLLAFNDISFSTILDWTRVGRLHCLQPWWTDATVNFMLSGGYDVNSSIKQDLFSAEYPVDVIRKLLRQSGGLSSTHPKSNGCRFLRLKKNVKQKTLIIYGEHDQIVNYKVAEALQSQLSNAIIQQVPNSGHLPHVDNAKYVAQLIVDFT